MDNVDMHLASASKRARIEEQEEAFTSLWRDLPELIRGYAPDDRYDVRELAYSVFDRYAKVHDEHGITRLRFAMTTQQDLRTEFFGREAY